MANISVKILKTLFNNPIWLGSGSLDDDHKKVVHFLRSEVGAIIPRTTRLKYAEGRQTHPSYHLDINPKGQWIRNCEWTGKTIDYWQPYLKKYSQTKRIIMSVSGREIEDCLKVCRLIDNYDFPLIEINISCAHSNEAHGFITRNSEHISQLVTTLKKNIKTPIALKLGHSDFIVELALIAQNSGADAIVAINTLGPVLDFDISQGTPHLTLGINNGKGGLSGKTIFQIALTDVADLAKNLTIPVIACGGVTEPGDAIKMLMAGASAVQIYSAAHLAGNQADIFINKFIKNFALWLDHYGYKNIEEIKGILLPQLTRQHQMSKIIPHYNQKSCTKCWSCYNICLEKAITCLTNKIQINPQKCIGCGACTSVCKARALI